MINQNTSLKISLFLLALLVFSGCSNKKAAVVDNGKIYYGKYNSYNKDKYRNVVKKTSAPTISTISAARNHQIEVLEGETIYTVSKKYQVPLRDLIKQNELNPPYKLKAGDKLTIPAPTYHQVVAGDTLYSVARLYKMNIDTLIELNDLKSPYHLIAGQKLRIVKFNNAAEATETKVVEVPNKKIAEVKEEKHEERNRDSVGFVERTLDKMNHFSWPVRGEIVSRFGPKSGGLYNDGINIKAKEGDSVKAAEDGVVSYAGNELKGYGNLIIVKHSGGWITAYAHLSKISVKRGQKVAKSTKIGEVGSTGNVPSAQLYFGLRKGRDAVNPENYLSK